MIHQITNSASGGVEPAQGIVTRREDGDLVTTSWDIWVGTKVQHKNVLELVRTHMSSLSKFGRVAFETRTFDTPGGPQQMEVATLTEPQSTLLIALMRNSKIVVDFKVALVQEFFKMRAALTAGNVAAPKTLRDALILALEQTETIERLETKISADAPKVEFAEAIRAVDGVCNIEKIAKTLNIGRNKFFKRLREDSVLMSNNLPYQKYIDREYFTVVEGTPYIDSKDVSHPTFTTMVTGAGQVFLARRYGAAAVAARAAQMEAEPA